MNYIISTHPAYINAWKAVATENPTLNLWKRFDIFQLQFKCKLVAYSDRPTQLEFESEEDLFLFLLEWS